MNKMIYLIPKYLAVFKITEITASIKFINNFTFSTNALIELNISSMHFHVLYNITSERISKSHNQLLSLSSEICFIIDHEYLYFFL